MRAVVRRDDRKNRRGIVAASRDLPVRDAAVDGIIGEFHGRRDSVHSFHPEKERGGHKKKGSNPPGVTFDLMKRLEGGLLGRI
jgi:hypothetical protein